MPRKDSKNFTERGKSKTGRYSTLDDDTSRSAIPLPKKNKRNPIGAIIAIFMILVIVGVGIYAFFNWDDVVNLSNKTIDQVNATPTPMPTKLATPTPTPAPSDTPLATVAPTPVESPTPPPEIADVTISAVGDIMIDQAQLDDAYDASTGTYDFSQSFAEIAPTLQKSDLVIGSILTTFAGEEYGYAGNPLYNTPDSMLTALANAGFDVLTTGNSHIFDYGWIGLERTNKKIRDAGISTTGTYLSESEYYDPLIINISGLNVAILSFTDEVFEQDKISSNKQDYCIKFIRKSRIRDSIELAKQRGAEVVIVCLHWGEEYERVPTDEMRSIAQYVLEQDADVILGTKSHMIQQAKVLSVKAERGSTKQRVVAYSLGNFISSQGSPFKDAGMILNLHFRKDNTTGEVSFTGADYVPTWVATDETDSTDKNYRILPVGKYLNNDELLNSLSESAKTRLSGVWTETTTVINPVLIPALDE